MMYPVCESLAADGKLNELSFINQVAELRAARDKAVRKAEKGRLRLAELNRRIAGLQSDVDQVRTRILASDLPSRATLGAVST